MSYSVERLQLDAAVSDAVAAGWHSVDGLLSCESAAAWLEPSPSQGPSYRSSAAI